MSINKKINALTTLIIIFMGLISLGSSVVSLKERGREEISQMKQLLLEERKTQMKDLTSNAISVIATANFYDDAVAAINGMRFGVNGENYFYVVDTDGHFYVHPAKPELVGTIQKDLTDSTGRKIIEEIITAAEEQGEGVIEYLWPKPGEEEPVKKLSYFKIFKEWKWIIATGLYMDDIDQAVALKEKAIEAEINATLFRSTLFLLGLLVFVVVLTSFLARRLSRPLRTTARMIRDMAQGEGDLTVKLDVRSRDEVGEFARWFNVFMENHRKMIGEIFENAETVNTSSSRLLEASRSVSGSAGDTKEMATAVSSASGKMNGNMVSAASAMEEAAGNARSIASATVEMRDSISEISARSEKTLGITRNAVTQGGKITATMKDLGSAAEEVDLVTQVISDISEKTNLLALNATIESARAGAAGKAFAVVAQEIKALAAQTKDATAQIKEIVSQIQGAAKGTVGEIGKITSVIEEIDSMMTHIAGTTDLQSERSVAISDNIGLISTNLDKISRNVSDSSMESARIDSGINDVDSASGKIASESSRVNQDAETLLELSETLKKRLGRFKI